MSETAKTLKREEEYQIISKHFSSITTIRKFALTKDFEWLQEVKDKLEAVIEENRELFEQAKKEAEEKEKKRLDLIKMIEDSGFSLDSLLNPVTTGKIKTKKKSSINARKPKYEFLDENGDIQTWSGNGKPPTALQKLLDDGNQLEDFLIKN
ncbi:H-NS family nucleoid-associated regulatory protein [Arsenophonus sp.]|uniref:H-NS histone family protein n=1 Tax=Arsenophonus sp. TaxID=1872640 RepID=UPI00286483FB|nr:H-NS family nucleoid-associated regulatory protein [Arsenophonus sp.]MDR5614938.1 H-NS family nucleoid-associated regulatory protein [Arsenophonus sp.]